MEPLDSPLEMIREIMEMIRENPQRLEMLKANPETRKMVDPELLKMLENAIGQRSGEPTKEELSPEERRKKYPVHTAAANGNVMELKYYILQGIVKSILKIQANLSGNGMEQQGRGSDERRMVTFFDINKREDKMNGTALHWASLLGQLEACQLLVENGADVNLKNKGGYSPADIARLRKNHRVERFLTSRGGTFMASPLNKACLEGDLTKVKREMLWLVVQSILGMQSSLLLASRGDLNDISFFEIDARGGKHGWSALMHATQEGHLEICQFLLQCGASVNLEDNNGWTPLMVSAFGGHLDVCHLLLERGASVNLIDNKGWTALMAAAFGGHLDVCHLLLNSGASVNFEDNEGDTALIRAAEKGHLDVCHLLLKSGANVNIKNNKGNKALMTFAHKGQLDTCRLLLKNGANVNFKDNEGFTALMASAQEGHLDVCRLLLKSGANVNLKNIEGATTLMLSAQEGHVDVCRLLSQR